MLVLVGLAILWVMVLAPEFVNYVRKASSSRPTSRGSIIPSAMVRPRTSYSTRPAPQAMRTTTLPYQGAMHSRISRQEAQRRRATVLFALSVLAVMSLVLAVSVGGIFIPIQLVLDLMLFGYMYLLVQRASVARERASKVRQIRPRQAEAAYAFADDYELGQAAYPMRRTVGY